jgi:WD40 repeat protein
MVVSIDETWATCLLVQGQYLLAGCADGAVVVWDVTTWKRKGKETGHEGCVTDLVALGDRVFTSGSDGRLCQWSLVEGHMECLRAVSTHAQSINRMCIAGGHVFTASDDCSIVPHNVYDLHNVTGLVGHFESVTQITSTSGMLLSGSTDGSVNVRWFLWVRIHA